MSYSGNNKNKKGNVGSSFEDSAFYQTTPDPPTQAETIMVECNRATAIKTDAGLNSQNNRWTCEFPSGIQIKTGDEVRVNSAYLSSIGVGDLISWKKSGAEQNNKARWIHSFYGCNDGKNDKREGYNIKGGEGTFYYDTDNRPCPLERIIDEVGKRPSQNNNGDYDFYWYEDPYCPMRFFGAQTLTISNSYGINPSTANKEVFIVKIENDGSTKKTKMEFYYIPTSATTVGNEVLLDPAKILSVGQSFSLQTTNSSGNSSFDGQFSNNNLVSGQFTANEIDSVNKKIYIEDLNDVITPQSTVFEGMVRFKLVQRQCSSKEYQANPQLTNFYATSFNYERHFPAVNKDYRIYEFQTLGDNAGTIENGLCNKLIDSAGDDVIATQVKDETDIVYNISCLTTEVNSDTTKIQIEILNPPFPIDNLTKLIELNGEFRTFYIRFKETTYGFEDIVGYALNGNCVYLGTPNQFQFNNVKRSCNQLQSPPPLNYTPPTTDCFLYRPDIGMRLEYDLNITKQQYYTMSKTYGVDTPPTNNQKTFYTFVLNQSDDTFYPSVLNTIREENLLEPAYNNSMSIQQYPSNHYFIQYIGDIAVLQNRTVPHYEYFDYEITDDYSSPSDISTELTKQTHALSNARDKDGNIILDSSKKGLLQNKLCIPVWTSFTDPETSSPNVEVPSQGLLENGNLSGTYARGSFLLKANLYNLPRGISNSTGTPTPIPDQSTLPKPYPSNGIDYIYFRTKNTTFNRPTDHTHTYDFYQLGYAQKSECKDQDDTVIGYPIQYIEGEECYASQYIGTNNLTFEWDDTDSRFAISFAHQPTVSVVETSATGETQGGQISATVYFPNPVGKDGYKYKLPQTRNGGINIENWNVDFTNVGDLTPSEVMTKYNLTRIEISDIINWWGKNDKNFNIIGQRFWEKLGFTTTTTLSKRGVNTEATSNNFEMLGTTDNLLDVADNILISAEASEDTPFYTSNGAFGGGSTNIDAKWKYASIGGLFTNNHAKGYGLPNTSGLPIEFFGSQGGGLDFDPLKSTFNPDRNWWNRTGFTVETTSDKIIADSLPIKSEEPYFFIISDLIKSNFFVSKDGAEINILGTLSKLNSAGDFVYQYQAPQVFYATEDRVLTSITTEIRTPSLDVPVAVSPYSSVIYQIVRYNPKPEPLPIPRWYLQDRVFNMLDANIKQLSTDRVNTSLKSQLNNIMEEMAMAVEEPDDQQATVIESLVERYNALDLARFRGNPRQLREFIRENPDASQFVEDLNVASSGNQQATTLNYEELREQMFSQYPRTNLSTPEMNAIQNVVSNPYVMNPQTRSMVAQMERDGVLQRVVDRGINIQLNDPPQARDLDPMYSPFTPSTGDVVEDLLAQQRDNPPLNPRQRERGFNRMFSEKGVARQEARTELSSRFSRERPIVEEEEEED